MDSLIALTPQGMMKAQTDCLGWADTKLAQAKQELVLAEQNYNALEKAKLRTQPAKTMIRKANVRIMFYEKVKAALDAGYYIIPPFDVQVFAIRTKRELPLAETGNRHWEREVNAQKLAIGEGEYKNPVPLRVHIDTQTEEQNGKPREVRIFENIDWKDLDMPVRAIKPTVIEATGKALTLKIFDALGIAPAYRSADPIIVGHLRRPENGAPLTFFVAWWLDYSDL
jgi:hypothetical protein